MTGSNGGEENIKADLKNLLLKAFIEKAGGECQCHTCEAGRVLVEKPELLDGAMKRISVTDAALLTTRAMASSDSVGVMLLIHTYNLASYILGREDSIKEENCG